MIYRSALKYAFASSDSIKAFGADHRERCHPCHFIVIDRGIKIVPHSLLQATAVDINNHRIATGFHARIKHRHELENQRPSEICVFDLNRHKREPERRVRVKPCIVLIDGRLGRCKEVRTLTSSPEIPIQNFGCGLVIAPTNEKRYRGSLLNSLRVVLGRKNTRVRESIRGLLAGPVAISVQGVDANRIKRFEVSLTHGGMRQPIKP